MKSWNNRSVRVLLQLLVSGGLLTLFVQQANPSEIWQSWQQINGGLLALAFAIQLAGHALSAAKWRLVLRAQGHVQPYSWLLRTYLIGQFANNFLPTTVGGDAVRVAQLGTRISSYAHAAASVLLERFTGLWALSVIGLLAIYLGNTVVPVPFTLLILATAGAATVVLLATGRTTLATRLTQQLPMPKVVRRTALKLIEAFQTTRSAPRAMGGVLGLSLLFQALWVLLHIVAAAALGMPTTPLLYAFMVPLTDIVGLAPIFFNNIGVREGVFTLFLSQHGVSTADAVALAVLVFSIRLAVSALGGLFMLVGGLQQARTMLYNQPPPPATPKQPAVEQ